tara:strand:+ start:261 stop:1556 length:1296 start_codon:yes stop_codon:yes gene_type:complete
MKSPSHDNGTKTDFRSSLLIKAGFGLTIVNVMVGLLGYVYQVFMGRMLDPAEFALFGALIGLFMFFSAPLGALSLVVTRQVSALELQVNASTKLRSFFLALNKLFVGIGVLFLVIMFSFAEGLQQYLKTDEYIPLWLFSLALVANSYLVICNAFLQGMKLFILLAASSLVGVIVKLVAGYILIVVGFGVSGALAGLLVSFMFLLLFAVPILVNILSKVSDGSIQEARNFPWSTIAPVLIANIAFAAMTQLDMVLVKHLFPAEQASIYYAASILGKAILYLPGGIVLALFPMVASNDAKGQSSSHMLMQAAGFAALLCCIVASIYWFLGDWIISLFYGSKYEGAGDILKLYGFAMLPMALVMVAEYFLIAKGRVLFAWIFLAVAPIQVLAIYTWHEELWMIVATIAAFGFLLAVVGYLFLWKEFRGENAEAM